MRMLGAGSGAVELTSGTTWHRRWYPRGPASVQPGTDPVRGCAGHGPHAEGPLRDRLGRRPRDLRISVTDRCNFRCTYCMPAEIFGRDYAFLPRSEILRYEEIVRLARIFVGLGVETVSYTHLTLP